MTHFLQHNSIEARPTSTLPEPSSTICVSAARAWLVCSVAASNRVCTVFAVISENVSQHIWNMHQSWHVHIDIYIILYLYAYIYTLLAALTQSLPTLPHPYLSYFTVFHTHALFHTPHHTHTERNAHTYLALYVYFACRWGLRPVPKQTFEFWWFSTFHYACHLCVRGIALLP